MPSPLVHSHLPVDALAHLTLPLLKGLSFAPLINSSLLPDLPPLLSNSIMTNAYRALQRRAGHLMMDHWRSIPFPEYYPFPLHLSPHAFMGLEKFIAGHLHQMRSQKRYLAAYPSWFNDTNSPLCQLCGDEPKSFNHAILRYLAKTAARAPQLQGVPLVGPHTPLWSSFSLLL